MKLSVLFGMDTLEIDVSPKGEIKTTHYTDNGRKPGGEWATIDSFLDDMYEIGYSRKCRDAFVKAGLLPG